MRNHPGSDFIFKIALFLLFSFEFPKTIGLLDTFSMGKWNDFYLISTAVRDETDSRTWWSATASKHLKALETQGDQTLKKQDHLSLPSGHTATEINFSLLLVTLRPGFILSLSSLSSPQFVVLVYLVVGGVAPGEQKVEQTFVPSLGNVNTALESQGVLISRWAWGNRETRLN